MSAIRLWEGVRDWDGIDDFVWREFEGELAGVWKPDGGEDEYFVYLLDDNRVVVYMHNEKSANVYEHSSLDDAADAGFDDVLYLMNVVSNHKSIEMWRKTFPFRSAVDFLLQ
jgi:hypothetical protein